MRWGAFRICAICQMISTCTTGPIKAVRGTDYIQFGQRKSARLAAEAPVYSSMSGSCLHLAVIREMFAKLVFSPGRPVPAGVTPSPGYGLVGSFRLPIPRPWCRVSFETGGRFVHPSALLGYVESASSVLCITITGDRLQAALRTPLSAGSEP